MGCCCSDCCKRNDDDSSQSSQEKNKRYASPAAHQGMTSPSAHQQNMKTGSNDYHTQILNLHTVHQNFMYEARRYQILVYRGQGFAEHHFIVVSDGVNEDITLELTVGGEKSNILLSQEKVMAAVNIYRGRRSDLENKGTVECTLHTLTEVAANILRRNPYYNLSSNNCQDFCNKFLNALQQETYMTDPTKAKIVGVGVTAGCVSSSAIVAHFAAGSR